jgi:hypothetical protein
LKQPILHLFLEHKYEQGNSRLLLWYVVTPLWRWLYTDIPLDPEKKKYFKIEASHKATPGLQYSKDAVKRRRIDHEVICKESNSATN